MLATNEAKQQNRLHPVGEQPSKCTPRFGQTLFAVLLHCFRKTRVSGLFSGLGWGSGQAMTLTGVTSIEQIDATTLVQYGG